MLLCQELLSFVFQRGPIISMRHAMVYDALLRNPLFLFMYGLRAHYRTVVRISQSQSCFLASQIESGGSDHQTQNPLVSSLKQSRCTVLFFLAIISRAWTCAVSAHLS